MSGTTYDDDVHAEFEADVQCASCNTSPVLITAPTDRAAEIARRIHANGINRRAPFLSIDCRRTKRPEQLIAAFEAAAPYGTVFLRDVGELPSALQALLSSRIAPLSLRVIAATRASLLRNVASGTFDERLFYRLNQIHIVAPGAGDAAGAE